MGTVLVFNLEHELKCILFCLTLKYTIMQKSATQYTFKCLLLNFIFQLSTNAYILILFSNIEHTFSTCIYILWASS